MDKKDLEAVIERIQSEIIKTEETVAEYKEMTKPIAPENAVGRLSRMDAINNKSVTEAALRQAEEKLKSLKFLIKKVDDSDFGLCDKCKKPIALPRLLFRPQSLFCVNCAS
jgi:DnaK suppressor protein